MKILVVVALSLAATVAAGAQGRPGQVASVHHQVSANAEAQAAFDRGLLDYYAYNPEAAEHEFYTAADLDKHLAMAYWGIALSNAPNLNVDPTGDRANQAREAIAQARALESYATPEDHAFIEAAASRFSAAKADPDALLANYRDALQRIARANPNDPDAAALYAEAALYVAVGIPHRNLATMTPEERTAWRSGIALLLPMFHADLANFPKHVGLLHFYIHASQMAGSSAEAVDAARELAAFSLPPEDSHLTHMPGHTFFDVGLYNDALDVATRSVAMDFADIDCCHPGYYSAVRYYHDHNVSFELYAMMQTGRTAEAVAVARNENNDDFIARALIANQQWQDVLALPYVTGKDRTLAFARGIAYAKIGNGNLAQQALSDMPESTNPRLATVGEAMRLTLAAQIAMLAHDDTKALELLTNASADAQKTKELGAEIPAIYYYSPHLLLAELATRLGKLDVARAALQAELVASPRSKKALDALAQLGTTPH